MLRNCVLALHLEVFQLPSRSRSKYTVPSNWYFCVLELTELTLPTHTGMTWTLTLLMTWRPGPQWLHILTQQTWSHSNQSGLDRSWGRSGQMPWEPGLVSAYSMLIKRKYLVHGKIVQWKKKTFCNHFVRRSSNDLWYLISRLIVLIFVDKSRALWSKSNIEDS